jgi:hypothetical protein
MATNLDARTWRATVGAAARASYRAALSHPSIVTAGITPETVHASVERWRDLLAAVASLVVRLADRLQKRCYGCAWRRGFTFHNGPRLTAQIEPPESGFGASRAKTWPLGGFSFTRPAGDGQNGY